MSETPPTPPTPGPQDPLPGSTPVTPAATTPEAADIEKNKMMAVLAYLSIFVLVPIVAAKDSPFAKYHANQGLILCIVTIAAAIALTIIGLICMFIPYIGWCASCVFDVAFVSGALALSIMGILNAVNGKMKPLPVIGGFTILK